MKTIVALVALIGSVAAAPAIIWTSESSATIHSSDVTELSSVVKSALPNTSQEFSLASAIFVVGRDKDGNDGLSAFSSSGSLPTIASKYSNANSIQHYVRGIDSAQTVTKNARSAIGDSLTVAETSLHEFHYLTNPETSQASVASDGSIMNQRKLASANVLVVRVSADADSKKVDSIISSAIANSDIGSVVLTSIRSIDEVKLERNLLARGDNESRKIIQKRAPRRRLEEDAEEEENDNNDNDSTKGVYFVNFSPNILAGLLFFFFFVLVVYIGIGCMDMIACGDIYVKKYPVIGREV